MLGNSRTEEARLCETDSWQNHPHLTYNNKSCAKTNGGFVFIADCSDRLKRNKNSQVQRRCLRARMKRGNLPLIRETRYQLGESTSMAQLGIFLITV